MNRLALLFVSWLLLVVVAADGPNALEGSAAIAHNWAPDDGCRAGLSPDGYFYAAGPAGGWGIVLNEGWNVCYMFTPNSTTIVEQWGEWYLPVSSNFNHTYTFYWYSPATLGCLILTDFAHYHTWPNGHSGGISNHVFKDQSFANCGNNYCNQIIRTAFNGSNGGFGDLWDSTSEPAGTKRLLYDIVCFYT